MTPVTILIIILLSSLISILITYLIVANRANKLIQELHVVRVAQQENLDLNQKLQEENRNLGQKNLRLQIELTTSNTRLEKIAELESQLEFSCKELEEKNKLEKILSSAEAKLNSSEKEIHDLKTRLLKSEDLLEKELNGHQQTRSLLNQEKLSHGQLRTELLQKEESFRKQIELLNETRENLKKEFELLANNILEVKSKTFKEQNVESLTNMLNPLKEDMKAFKERIEIIHKEDIEQTSSLKTELLNLQGLNKEITEQAEKLTSALRSDKKKLGNWGELLLDNVLESSGLRLGIDYETQKSFKDDDGDLVLPDAIVNLPQGKHIVIDAKTSLNAYTDYVNTEDPTEKEIYLTAHAKAVGDRIAELSNKNYFKIPRLNSPEVVIMFIPVESAYVEAIRYDSNIYQRALQQNILVTTPTTLLTSLNIVAQLWRFEEKNKHTEELARRASRFYEKLNTFLQKMIDLGRQLDKAKDSYATALGQLSDGRGNLIKQASEFKELGISVQKELPNELVEKAKLELEMNHGQEEAL